MRQDLTGNYTVQVSGKDRRVNELGISLRKGEEEGRGMGRGGGLEDEGGGQGEGDE